MTDDRVIDRLRRDGLLADALGFLLRRSVSPDRTTSMRCLRPDAHRNGDANPSCIVEPQAGRVVCRVCGLDVGLLELGVTLGRAATKSEVAKLLDEQFYGGGRRGASVTADPGRVTTSGAAEWPHYPKTAESLGWTVGRTPGGRRSLRLPTEQVDGEPGRVKVRFEKAPGQQSATFEGSEPPIGLIVDDILRDAIAGEQCPTIALLAGETDFLAWVRHARSEGLCAPAFSMATGEGTRLGAFARLFANCHVIVFYDNDKAGRAEGPKRVAELLAAGAASAVSIHVPDPYADVCDFLRGGGTVRVLLDAATKPPPASLEEGGSVAVATPETPQWRPFPVDVLPQPIAEFVDQTARALGCDASLVALPCLAALASAIGNSHVIRLKDSWKEPAVIWTAPIAESGGLKSPAFDAAVEPLVRRQTEALVEHQKEFEAYAVAQKKYSAQFAAWKKDDGDGEPPDEPATPKAERLVVQDTTIEALAQRLADAPRGLLLAREELSGWLRSFDAYRGGRGGDEAQWLLMYGARALIVDRKTGQPTIMIPRAAVSITGTIQPRVMAATLSREQFESGLVARFLVAYPPRSRKHWNERAVRPQTQLNYDRIFGELLAWRPESDRDGVQPPVPIGLDANAHAAWVEYYDEIAERQSNATGDEAAMLAKIEGVAARLALIFHCVRAVSVDAMSVGVKIDKTSMHAGIVLARWFASEAERVYGVFAESPEEQAQRDLLDWLRRRRGGVTIRDLTRGPRRYRGKHKDAEAALDALVKGGLGTWRESPATAAGGRPTVRFFLLDQTDSRVATATEPRESSLGDDVPSPQIPVPPPEDVASPGGDETTTGEQEWLW